MRQAKTGYVSDMEKTANDGPVALTLRQLHRQLRGPAFWIVVGGMVLIAAVAGPYYTLERLNFAERLVNWGVIIGPSAVLMTFLSALAHRVTEAWGWNWALVALLAGIGGILPVLAIVWLAGGLAAGFGIGGPGIATLAAYVAPSVIGVTLAVNAYIEVQDRMTPAAPAMPAPRQPEVVATVLQGKLPHHLGREIVALRAQDHYLEVTTAKGQCMVLMRLGDAVRDLEGVNGMQVHRSWWISLDHVARVEKGANGPEVVMRDGQRVPVGRSYRAAFRAGMAGRG
ncbi:LytTR family DNA-binding domain-containing protein [Seohaeicola saemankumensis]|uniref:LytTR family DNA-binding domain-containing protein n=1 Tax=Seohaeicola saemankumensis TaxID=481181 RepID=A0ABW3TH56_9RHOB